MTALARTPESVKQQVIEYVATLLKKPQSAVTPRTKLKPIADEVFTLSEWLFKRFDVDVVDEGIIEDWADATVARVIKDILTVAKPTAEVKVIVDQMVADFRKKNPHLASQAASVSE